MYKARRRIALTLIYVFIAVIFVILAILLVPQIKINDFRTYTNVFPTSVTAVLFGFLLLTGFTTYETIRLSLERRAMEGGATELLTRFINKLRFCYSLEDFYSAIASILEEEADCSVLYVDRKTNYTLYSSPARLTSNPAVIEKLAQYFPVSWNDGFYFLGNEYGVVSSSKNARGFFLAVNGQHLYVFCRYARRFDNEIYPKLYDEFGRFQNRAQTISSLSEISELTTEWEVLADTQRSFLPQVMPEIKNMKLAAYFRPLINVSGDYYTVLPIDEHKTLLMLGDVSGKGLAAALVMGLVMNTVKTMVNKKDLVAAINAVDSAIKGMALQDKYTVLFMGIVDTEKMTIRYINASMSDPIIVTKSPDGYRIKSLGSNCSIVGIIPLDDIEVAEQRLFSGDLIMMASDGVSEVMNDKGVELGDTDLFTDTIKKSASKDPQAFIDDIINLVMAYNGNKKLRDDVTMLVAKVKG